jgi:uncharacterized protein YoxC
MKSLLIVALLAVGAFAVAVPAPAFASSGHPNIVASTDQTNPFTVGTVTVATYNVTAPWGSAVLSAVDNTPLVGTNYFVLDLAGVTFDGAQFSLWLSPNGFSNINQTAGSGDVLITQTFNVSSLGGPTVHVGNYYLGTDTDRFISGPITSSSTDLPGGIYYVKVFDGTSTAVAVSAQFIIILPAITIKPTFGPAGADLKVTGHAFSAGGTVNLSIQAPLATWFGTANTTASALGNFSVSIAALGFRVPDLQNGASLLVPANVTTDIEVVAFDYGTGSSAQAAFVEAYREFYWLQAYRSGTTIGDNVGPGAFANMTAINGWVLQNLFISGLYFNPTNPTPTFTWDGNAIAPTHLTTINSTGYFDANFTVPISGLGAHFLRVFDATNNLTVVVNVQTTLIISPTEGPEGSTVTVTGYGFTANANVTVYWWGTELVTPSVDQGVDYILLFTQTNITAGSFTFTFAVPSGVYGGDHDIFANDTGLIEAVGVFFVTPTWGLSSNSGALGSKFFVIGSGLPVGSSVYETAVTPFSDFNGDETGADAYAYQLTYDNVWAEYPAAFYGLASGLSGDTFGDANYTMVAAGVPMTHFVGVVRADFGSYVIDGSFAFAVLGNTTGDQQILTAIAGQTSLLTGLQSSMTSLSSSVTALTTTVNGISTTVNGLQTSLTSLTTSQASAFASLNSAVSTLNTAVNNGFTGVNSAITSLGSSINTGFAGLGTKVDGVTTTLGGKIDPITTAVTALGTSVSTLSGNVNTLSGKVDTLTTTTTSINSATGSLGTITTVLYIAVILAAIAVVLELVLLIRKK